MIGKITGKVDFIAIDHAIIDVSGVGYNIFLTSRALQNLRSGDHKSFFIETHMREDHIHLYGFEEIEEKQSFNLLTSISGVGPKLGLAILSKMSPTQIADAIANANKEAFSSVSGVGARMAGRIIIELKDKFKNIRLTGAPEIFTSSRTGIQNDAVASLVSLGIQKSEAESLIDKIGRTEPNASLDEMVRAALSMRGRG